MPDFSENSLTWRARVERAAGHLCMLFKPDVQSPTWQEFFPLPVPITMTHFQRTIAGTCKTRSQVWRLATRMAQGKFACRLLVSCSAYSSTMKMEAISFSKTSTDLCRTTRRYNLEDRDKNKFWEGENKMVDNGKERHTLSTMHSSLTKHGDETSVSRFDSFTSCKRSPG